MPDTNALAFYKREHDKRLAVISRRFAREEKAAARTIAMACRSKTQEGTRVFYWVNPCGDHYSTSVLPWGFVPFMACNASEWIIPGTVEVEPQW